MKILLPVWQGDFIRFVERRLTLLLIIRDADSAGACPRNNRNRRGFSDFRGCGIPVFVFFGRKIGMDAARAGFCVQCELQLRFERELNSSRRRIEFDLILWFNQRKLYSAG